MCTDDGGFTWQLWCRTPTSAANCSCKVVDHAFTPPSCGKTAAADGAAKAWAVRAVARWMTTITAVIARGLTVKR